MRVSLSPVTPVNGHHEWSEVGVLVSRSVHFGSLVQESATDLGMAVPGSQQQRIELHRQRKRGEREREVSRKSFFQLVRKLTYYVCVKTLSSITLN